MQYEELTEKDIPEIAAFYLDYYNTCEKAVWTTENVCRRIHQVISMEGSFGLTATESDGTIIAFAMGFFQQYDDGVAYHLEEIVVARNRQGSGIGSALMAELEKRTRERGAFLIQMDAVRDRRHDRFYEKLGYEVSSNLVIRSKLI